MLEHRYTDEGDKEPASIIWLVSAPWAHPVWNDYAIMCYDLTTSIGVKPVIYKEGVTHEVIVFAINPEFKPPTTAEELEEMTKDGKKFMGNFLSPANHAYQFKATSDEEAFDRIADIATLIEDKELSPDTDLWRSWDMLFRDGASLKQR